GRRASERGKQRPRFHLGFGARPQHGVEVIVEPHRVEAQLVGATPVARERVEARALLRSLDAEVDRGGDGHARAYRTDRLGGKGAASARSSTDGSRLG